MTKTFEANGQLWVTRVLALLGFLGLASLEVAQGGNGELDDLRKKYGVAIAKAKFPHEVQFTKDLEALRRTVMSAGDLDGPLPLRIVFGKDFKTHAVFKLPGGERNRHGEFLSRD